MNLNFEFKSTDHLRYENGRHVSGPHGGAPRLVKVEPNISGSSGFSVSIYNLDGNHPIWQNNIQMSHKQMKPIEENPEKIVLRGFGYDQMGGSFADYGLTIHLDNDNISKCMLHMYDRNVDIEYLKDSDQTLENSNKEKNEITVFQDFFHKWFSEIPLDVREGIAKKSDEINNIGCKYYDIDNYENAIQYFDKALEILPINDDAMKNLIICYNMIGKMNKIPEIQEKLDYLKKIGYSN